ncbi:MAG: L-threonylcarbamoyladenylate synthase [Candidatus Woesearchaeota archaeon]|nr:L-threonylcarbamoyladenylate synthase [Candidatus Woesearchaeota archaeon]
MNLEKAIEHLKNGEVIGFPTETLYGLAADAFNEDAVSKIFELKERPPEKSLIVLISSKEQLTDLVQEIPKEAETLMEKHWPGPLTIVFKKKKGVPDIVAKDTIAVRMERHTVARELIENVGPLVAPSANKDGQQPPETAAYVRENFPELYVVDGGDTLGIASTIISVVDGLKILREGAIRI